MEMAKAGMSSSTVIPGSLCRPANGSHTPPPQVGENSFAYYSCLLNSLQFVLVRSALSVTTKAAVETWFGTEVEGLEVTRCTAERGGYGTTSD